MIVMMIMMGDNLRESFDEGEIFDIFAALVDGGVFGSVGVGLGGC